MFSRLYNIFPRQLGFPNRITVSSPEEFIQYVDYYNGMVRVYASVYNYVPGQEHSIVLDKVFLDFDGDTAFRDTKRVVDLLSSTDTLFTVNFSGGGFHVYFYLDTTNRVINRRDCLTNIQKHIEHECNVTIDPAVIGDLARIATVPNTYNLKRKKYCIPLMVEDFDESLEFISNLATLQQMNMPVYGTQLFDPKPFDRPTPHTLYSRDTEYVFEHSTVDLGSDIEKLELHPCIYNMLASGRSIHCGFRARFHLITYLRDIGVPIGDTNRLVQQNLTNIHDGLPEWKHCFNKKQIQRIYRDTRYGFTRCDKLNTEGYCPERGYCGRVTNYGEYYKADIYK